MNSSNHFRSRSGSLIVRGVLAAALAVACALAFSQRPSPRPAPLHEQPRAPGEQEKADEDSRAGRESPLAIKGEVSAAIKGEITTTKSAEEQANDARQEKERSSNDRFMRWMTLATVGITGLLAALTAALAYFTWGLWKKTGNLVADASETAKTDLRAYVALEHIFFNTKIERGISFTMNGDQVPIQNEVVDHNDLRIRIRNHGRTPAHRMTIRAECSLIPPNLSTPHSFSSLLVDEQMLHPGQHYTKEVPMGQVFVAHSAPSYVVGRMTYHDVYGSWWITEFCYLYSGVSGFTPYGDHNRERGPYQDCPE